MYNVKISIRFMILGDHFKTTDKVCYEMFKFPFIPIEGLILKISEDLKSRIVGSIIWNLEEDQFEVSLDSRIVNDFGEIPFELRFWNFI